MKKIILTTIVCLFSLTVFSQDMTSDINNAKYLPRIIRANVFEKEILNNITKDEDRQLVLQYYFKDAVSFNYYLRSYKPAEELLKVYNVIYSYKATHGVLALEKAKVLHENEEPVFSQKGGMLRPGDNSFYFRTDDEWTGFSTIFLGYRYGVTDYFNIAVEGGIGLPEVYIFSVLFHFKVYETPNKFFFMGVRARFGYKYQNADRALFSANGGYLGLGKNYLTIQDRYSFYFAPDLTVAFRFGRLKGNCVYYTIFPKVDFNIRGGQPYVLFCPVMIGYEVRFGHKMEWSFAVEGGYTFPIPWGSVPAGQWVNFPSLANVSVNYRFGDKYYWKKNRDKIYNDAMSESKKTIIP